MISAIVYGRNDNFNYELNRRTTMGLNQLAEQLNPERDEILFVDYNTDNDLPTQPEAIADCLTDRARNLIRVIRVRPEFHAQITSVGPPVREAVCRNIALRRVSADCQWVLSTNPDCLLLSSNEHTLASAVEDLLPGYYGLPRFELPRVVWETLPRRAPSKARDLTLSMAATLHLEERVSHYLAQVGFDAPGDFQLFQHCDAVAIGGFNESMSLGWHVDSNLNARLALLHEVCLDLNQVLKTDFKLFHTEHTRRASAKHSAGHAEDSFRSNVEEVEVVEVPGQEDWGSPNEEFEEFPLAEPPVKLAIDQLRKLFKPQTEPSVYTYGPKTHDRIVPYREHCSAFVLDHLAYLPVRTVIGFLSEDPDGLAWFQKVNDAAGRGHLIRSIERVDQLNAELPKIDVLVIEVEQSASEEAPTLAQVGFAQWVRIEQERLNSAEAQARTVIAINAPHSLFEGPFLSQLEAPVAPVATRLRFGKVRKIPKQPIDLLQDFKEISLPKRESGYIAICRVPFLTPGRWRLDYDVEVGRGFGSRVVLDVAVNAVPSEAAVLTDTPSRQKSGTIWFETHHEGLFLGDFECRLWSNQEAEVAIQRATITPVLN